MKDYYTPGDWLILCDVCGKKMKASHARHRWDGLIVCDKDFEHRHSHDFIKTKVDKQWVPYSRPETTDVFIDVPYTVPLSCTPLSSYGEADRGTANCARAGLLTPGDLVT